MPHKSGYGKQGSKTKSILKKTFGEVFANEPKIVAKTRAKKGEKQAMKQKVAISVSKARRAGARIPKKG